MINQTDNPVQWALLLYELDDAKEHLESLIGQMAKEGTIDEEDYAVQLGHLFAHLNRNWNARNLGRELTREEHERYSRFPNDLEPIG